MPLVPVVDAYHPLPNGVSTGAVSFGPNSLQLEGEAVEFNATDQPAAGEEVTIPDILPSRNTDSVGTRYG